MTNNNRLRCSGILLHITSLPSLYGVGDLGPSAYHFVDMLCQAKQSIWQILPINPTSFGNSPYSCTSAFAINPLLISPELLIEEGMLFESDLEALPEFSFQQVDYSAVLAFKLRVLLKSYERFMANGDFEEFDEFSNGNEYWLQDFCLFSALKKHFSERSWIDWAEDIQRRKPETMSRYSEALQETLQQEKYFQFVLFRQWNRLQAYCRDKRVQIFGDVALYVNHDSADVWAHPEFFKLDESLRSEVVAGVPPDYFSETGQKWGNPVFDWDALRDDNFSWWFMRMKHNLGMFDLIRIDHFRGFLAAWEIPVEDPDAVRGCWQKCPGVELFDFLQNELPSIPVVAEDLGFITQDVKDAMTQFGFPGMKIMLFAFDGDMNENPYAPANHVQNCFLYTGTHDCNTVRGWYDDELTEETKTELESVLDKKVCSNTVSEAMVILAMSSIADTVILPMQDVLGLGANARMNRPGQVGSNWEWRLLPDQWTNESIDKIAETTHKYGRC